MRILVEPVLTRFLLHIKLTFVVVEEILAQTELLLLDFAASLHSKIQSKEIYSIYYQDMFGEQLGNRVNPHEKIMQQILNMKYFVLL